MNNTRHFLVIDLEATCDQGRRLPRDQMEIIEIGAVLVEPQHLQIVDEFQTFVRPVRHHRLRPFCTELTSITQEMVDAAPLFPEALLQLRDFIGQARVTFCSWGAYDKNQFLQDAEFHSIKLPFDVRRHINLKARFQQQFHARRGFGLSRAIKKVGLRFEGTHHRGIDDARNIARLLPWCLGRAAEAGVIPPDAGRGGRRPRRRGRG
ncbi:MAG: 3'-5' exonuclease [Myxococcota bacterium]